MNSPALALTWQVWRRQRWLWVGAAVYVLALAVVCQALPVVAPGQLEYRPIAGRLGLIPLLHVAIFALGCFALMSSPSDFEKHSGFPTWMLALPVRTRTMVVFVMLNGTVALSAAWLAVLYLVLRPCEIEVPWSLALMGPGALAWIQVLSWTPFATRLVRLTALLAILTAISTVPPLLECHYEIPLAFVIALQAAVIGVAYPLAEWGVARARRGVGLDESWLGSFIAQFADRLPRRRQTFASAEAAQLWFEWRRNGLLFCHLAACLLGLACVAAYFGPFLFPEVRDGEPSFELVMLHLCLTIPLWLSMFFGAGMGKGDMQVQTPSYPPFLAVRPLPTATFVTVKLRITAWSALAVCVLALVAALICLPVHANPAFFRRLWHSLPDGFPAYKLWLFFGLAPIIYFVLTWKNLVEGLWVGLTGRNWVVAVLIWSFSCVLPVLGGAVVVFKNFPEYREYIWISVRCVAGLALAAKAGAAVWVAWVLQQRRFVTVRVLAWLVLLWFLAVGSLFGLVLWLFPAGPLSPAWLAAGCVLAVPFVRLAVMPLALEWNRHR